MGLIVDGVNQVTEFLDEDIAPPPSFGTRMQADHLVGMGSVDKKFVLILDIDRVLLDHNLLPSATTQSAVDNGRVEIRAAEPVNNGLRANGNGAPKLVEKSSPPPVVKTSPKIKVEKQDQTASAIEDPAEEISDLPKNKEADPAIERWRQVAVEAAQLKSEFLTNLGHELRTPMNGIIGMTKLTLLTNLSDEQREYLGMVKSAAHSMMGVVNDLQDYLAIESGKMDLSYLEFHLRDLITDIINSIAEDARAKGLELNADVAIDVPDSVIGDPGRLRQVITKLLGNAVKFTDSGEVSLRVRAESMTDDKAVLNFSVKDTGIGIAADKQAMIFQPFTQEDGSATRKYGGTGLGLTISSKLVEMMGGRIWVESEKDRGSTFHFTVTFNVKLAPKSLPLPVTPMYLHGLHVMVIADDIANRHFLEDALYSLQMCPSIVESGADAVDMLIEAHRAAESFSLVLIDMCLSEEDGFEVAEQIREVPELNTATLVLLVSAGFRGDASRCQSLNISAYLVKPVTQTDLMMAIIDCLGTHSGEGGKPALITRHTLRDSKDQSMFLATEGNLLEDTTFIKE